MTSFFSYILKSPTPTLPLIVDEMQALSYISEFSGFHITSLDECHTGMIPAVMLYEKEEEKQSLSIKQIRKAKSDMSEKPYEGKVLFIFRDFDTASLEAMNASLKILEEPPVYAIILLVVSNPENIIETIRSRTITYFSQERDAPMSEDIREAISAYKEGNESELIHIVSSKKLEQNETIHILKEMIESADSKSITHIERAIVGLMTINENPKNILDRVILGIKA